jgi:hypothetical protein
MMLGSASRSRKTMHRRKIGAMMAPLVPLTGAVRLTAANCGDAPLGRMATHCSIRDREMPEVLSSNPLVQNYGVCVGQRQPMPRPGAVYHAIIETVRECGAPRR